MNTQEIEIGNDETLFLIGGNHSVLSYFTGNNIVPESSKKNYFANLKKRQLYCDKNGIIYKNFIFPDKLYVYSHLHTHDVKSLYLNSYQDSEFNNNDIANLYLGDILIKTKESFLKTDTHLSLKGNTASTIAMIHDLFPDAVEIYTEHIEKSTRVKNNFSGDLGVKFSPVKTESIEGYQRPEYIVMSDNGVLNGNDGIMVLCKNKKAISDKTLMIFGDSFFRALLPHLSFFYRKIVFCRTRFFHNEIIKGFQPDVIFTGIAERYLSRCVHDSKRPHFFTYPLIKGKMQNPSQNFSDLFTEFCDREGLL